MNLDDYPYYEREYFRLKENTGPSTVLGLEVDYIEGVFNPAICTIRATYSTKSVRSLLDRCRRQFSLSTGGF